MMHTPAHSQTTQIGRMPATLVAVPAKEPEIEALSATFAKDAPLPAIATGRIQVLNGSSVGRELVLNKALTTLGKTGVQVAVITKRPHGYFITHVEGKVFPIVNGNSTGAQAFELSDHDVIELAGVKMEFYLDKV
jgi:phosphatidylserine/phosphatidylglycerophosphate/cardiolipin synthase-like enzyme